MKCFWLIDSTGHEWLSDPDLDGEMTPEALEQVVETLRNFREINELRLTIGGVAHYFNPANVIAWAIKEVGE